MERKSIDIFYGNKNPFFNIKRRETSDAHWTTSPSNKINSYEQIQNTWARAWKTACRRSSWAIRIAPAQSEMAPTEIKLHTQLAKHRGRAPKLFQSQGSLMQSSFKNFHEQAASCATINVSPPIHPLLLPWTRIFPPFYIYFSSHPIFFFARPCCALWLNDFLFISYHPPPPLFPPVIFI